MKTAYVLMGWFVAMTLASAGSAQEFPNKPIRIIIPFTPGSQTDLIARTIGAKLAENTGQQVVIDNRPGAGGIVAGGILVGATPDGHTLQLTSNAFAVSAALYTKMPYDSIKDIVGIGQVASGPLILVVGPQLGVKSVRDLIAMVKSRPGKMTFGSAGIGSGTHMGGEQFKFAAALDVTHVPYRGTPEALIDTSTGRIHYWFSPLGPAAPFIKDGRVIPLAVTTAQRSPMFPDVPSVAEAALPGFDYDTWYGIFAPGKTPRAIVGQVNEAVSRVIMLPEIQDRLRIQGVIMKASSVDAFQKMVVEDIGKLSRIMKAAGIKVD